MAALVQGYPQPSGTVTMLQTRPTSASGMLQTVQTQANPQYGHPNPQQRSAGHGFSNGAAAPMVYRGSSTPIQPYAFTNTPSLTPAAQWQQFRQYRTTSSPAAPTMQTIDYNQIPAGRPRYSASVSMTNLPSTGATTSLQGGALSRDDSALPVPGTRRAATAPRPQVSYANGTPSQSSLAPAAPIRVSPERYRRVAMRSSDSGAPMSGQQSHGPVSANSITGQGMAHTYGSRTDQKNNLLRSPHVAQLNRPNSVVGALSGSAIDDMQLPAGQSQEEMKRVRRRSMPALDSAGFSQPLTPPEVKRPEESTRLEPSTFPKSTDAEYKPAGASNNLAVVDRGTNPAHGRAGSSDSRSSARSGGSSPRSSLSANRSANGSSPTGNPAQLSSEQASNSQDYPRLVNIPPRSSSSDAANTKRPSNPSPLSKPVAMDTEAAGGEAASATTVVVAAVAAPTLPMKPASPRIESPAVRQLSAINEQGNRPKSKTSRLRRAFSFSSAAEFRKVAHENEAADAANSTAAHAKLHKERDPEDAYNAEQDRIAQRQEAAGIGNNIYSGGKIFSGSTDNISISSTASSASIMIRKMGRGMKKGTRSLVGLFRPKSVIGVPAADSKLPEASEATVSMVTAEAERELVNISGDVHSHAAGGTGFPHLERNSVEAVGELSAAPERLGSSGADEESSTRKSIVGSEKERAEVLAAVRKGILKNTSASATPSPRPPAEAKTPALDMPTAPTLTESPNSSAPSTPNEELQGHRRSGPISIGNEDYFVSALRLRQDTKSAPGTPQGTLKRNATFSPRLAFYETWPSQEYDRRGEIATCNRLTPMLAQQIKEELNTFKMVRRPHL
ncbi:hypothetical protein B0T26DRAFT_238364 [Lasiosphaeria miniovina]|uniref:Protein BNI4 n=1 Tax=Lasiosphaeria miniovina TaxID=1954250 RepID=A0AA40E2T3_9PEZI|nr:uncharacterized protein B0T26DRAFT_238364 [Lasiosphaeria miniovina]KAK0722872.1 hypothetical protein B0T26DRAFT_238364 [Lasiosphaeria miniovina]